MDHLSDPSGRLLTRVLLGLRDRGVEIPGYVKKAEACPAGRAAFADMARRLYPCDTAADTWLSAACYAASGRPDGRVEAGLRKAAGYWGNAEEVGALLRPGDPPPAAPAADYAYDEGGVRRCPLRHAADVKAAAAWLERYRDQIPYGVRRQMATRILAKAAALTTSTGREDFLQKQAGVGYAGDRPLLQAVGARVTAAEAVASPAAGAARKLAAAVSANPQAFRNPDASTGLVEALEGIDRELGRGYGPGYPRPEDAVYAVTPVKLAEVKGSLFPWPDGREFVREAFADLPAGALGPDCGVFGVDPEKAAAVYVAADDAGRAGMNEALTRHGVRPVSRWLTREELRAIAG